MDKAKREELKQRVKAGKVPTPVRVVPDTLVPMTVQEMAAEMDKRLGVAKPESAGTPAKPAVKHKPCGHSTPLANFENSHCPACRNKAKQAKAAKKKATQNTKPRVDRGRLPIGSSFISNYVADATWEAALSIPDAGTFTGTGTSVVKAVFAADGAYRAWLANVTRG
jgi:hypothetical protein